MKRLILILLVTLLAAVCVSGTGQTCLSYLNNYGFFRPQEKCFVYCCGSCLNRYCCSNSEEVLLNQDQCQNNQDQDIDNHPIKSQTCFSYIDRYENVISELKCDWGEFCGGDCRNRYCTNFDYQWFDQTACQNTVNTTTEGPVSSTSQRPFTSTTETYTVLVSSTLFMISIALVIICLFTMVVVLLFKLNTMERLLQTYRRHERIVAVQVKPAGEAPPPYEGLRY